MGNYIKREKSPVGGEIHKSQEIRVVEKVVEKDVDISVLAEAMAEALLNHLPQGVQAQPSISQTLNNSQISSPTGDTFDSSKTLESLAKSMLVSRNETESNMGDMGKNTIITKNDNKNTNNTINLLSDLDD